MRPDRFAFAPVPDRFAFAPVLAGRGSDAARELDARDAPAGCRVDFADGETETIDLAFQSPRGLD